MKFHEFRRSSINLKLEVPVSAHVRCKERKKRKMPEGIPEFRVPHERKNFYLLWGRVGTTLNETMVLKLHPLDLLLV